MVRFQVYEIVDGIAYEEMHFRTLSLASFFLQEKYTKGDEGVYYIQPVKQIKHARHLPPEYREQVNKAESIRFLKFCHRLESHARQN